jgi:hypothetical protein
MRLLLLFERQSAPQLGGCSVDVLSFGCVRILSAAEWLPGKKLESASQGQGRHNCSERSRFLEKLGWPYLVAISFRNLGRLGRRRNRRLSPSVGTPMRKLDFCAPGLRERALPRARRRRNKVAIKSNVKLLSKRVKMESYPAGVGRTSG